MERRKRPRALSLTLPNMKQPFLILGGQRYTLRNFSQSGIGLWVPPAASLGLSVGNKINGDVVIENEIFPVQLEVVRYAPGMMGLKILYKSAELTRLLETLLQPVTHASQLTSHAESGGEDVEFGYPKLWFVGTGASELLIWYNDFQKMVMALQLCWLGKWVFRHQFKPTRTGLLKDAAVIRNGVVVGESELAENHETADRVLSQEAAQFLTAVPPPLPGYLLWQFVETGEQTYLPSEMFQLVKVA